MATYRGVSTTWWGVYRVSIIAPLARWCQSAARMLSVCFRSIAMLVGILVTYFWISSYNWALDQVLTWSYPSMTNFFSSECWMEIFNPTTWIFFFDGIVGVTSLNPTLVPLVQSLGDLSLERVLLVLFYDIVHSYSSHKNLMALHHLIFTLHHTTCITITKSHKHQLTNAF
jgi:hypothetical protein